MHHPQAGSFGCLFTFFITLQQSEAWFLPERSVVCVCSVARLKHIPLQTTRSSRVRSPEEPRGGRVPKQDANVLRGEVPGAAEFAVATVDGVQLPVRAWAVQLPGGRRELQIKARQKALRQRQVWVERCESSCCFTGLWVNLADTCWSHKERCRFDWKNNGSDLSRFNVGVDFFFFNFRQH